MIGQQMWQKRTFNIALCVANKWTEAQTMTEYVNEENCTECVHHDIFWEGSGCNLLNNMEFCRFEQKDLLDLSLLFASLEEIIDAAD